MSLLDFAPGVEMGDTTFWPLVTPYADLTGIYWQLVLRLYFIT